MAAAGTVTSTIYSAMVMVGAVRFRFAEAAGRSGAGEFLPPVSVLKPLHGVEPDLEENLRRFFELDYPDYEVLFCARQGADEGLADGGACGGPVPGGAGAVFDVWGAGVSECQDVVAGVAGGGGGRTRCW